MGTHDFQLGPSLRGTLKTSIMKADFQGLKSPESWNPPKTSQACQSLAFTKAQATEKRKRCLLSPLLAKNPKIIQVPGCQACQQHCHSCLLAMRSFMLTSFVPAACVGRKSCRCVPVCRNVAAMASGITGGYL